MSDETEPALTLESIADFHRQLMRLHNAGLHLQIQESQSEARDLPGRLNEIMAILASETGKARPLEKVLAESPEVPLRYRLALETWTKADRAIEALAMLRAPVQQATEGAIDLRFALLLPVIVLTLVYAACFYLFLVTVPRIEAIYLQLRMTPSLAVQSLMAIRQALPILAPAIPLLGVLIGWLIVTGRWALPRWLPGRKQAINYLSASLVARNLAVQLEQRSGDAALDLVASKNEKAAWLQSLLNAPMLRWALTERTRGAVPGSNTSSVPAVDPQQDDRAVRLRLAANLYETMQSIRVQQTRTWLILLASVVLGGGVTLLYGLALFAPLIQMLKDIVGY